MKKKKKFKINQNERGFAKPEEGAKTSTNRKNKRVTCFASNMEEKGNTVERMTNVKITLFFPVTEGEDVLWSWIWCQSCFGEAIVFSLLRAGFVLFEIFCWNICNSTHKHTHTHTLV